MSKRSGYKKFLGLIAAIGLGVLSAGQAQAGYTSISAPNFGRGGEATQAEILSHSYGGNFVADGLNFSNGSVTAYRIDDDFDQVMPFDILSSRTLATFASYSQGLAYGTLADEHQLFTVSGKGYAATGGTGAVDLPNPTELIRTGTSEDFSSKDASNSDGKDHLVTYLLVNDVHANKASKPELTFVLFWEDLSKKSHSDWDFNDLAVEIKASCPVVVPLPAAAWSGLATLAGGALVTGYRKARRQMA